MNQRKQLSKPKTIEIHKTNKFEAHNKTEALHKFDSQHSNINKAPHTKNNSLNLISKLQQH
jgi:hypothetical protein